MQFEHPAALALALFILLLLFTRRQSRGRMAVANLYLWREAVESSSSRLAQRVHRHRRMLLQAAALLAMVAGLAAPAILRRDVPVAVVIDASMSMGASENGTSRARLAQERARQLLDGLPSATTVRVIAARSVPEALGEFRASDSRATAAIDAVEPTHGTSDLAAAVQQARAGEPAPARIYVLSDGGRAQHAEVAAADVQWLTVGSPADNIAVTELSTYPLSRGESPETAGVVRVLVGLTNHGAPVGRATLRLLRDGAEIARRDLRLAANTHSTEFFSAPNMPGELVAVLDHQDALAIDNRRTTVVAPRRIEIAVSGRLSPILEAALTTHPDVVLAPGGSASPVDVVVCHGCDDAAARGTLLVAGNAAPDDEPVPLVAVNVAHPLADGVSLDATTAVVGRHSDIPADSTILIEGGGAPALLVYEREGRRIVDMRLDPGSGSLRFSPAFPVLVANALAWLADDSATAETAGEPLRWRLRPGDEAPLVIGPRGQALQGSVSNGVLTSVETFESGTYYLRVGSTEHRLAINPAVHAESDLSAPAEMAAQPVSAVADASFAVDATPALLLLALLLLAAEWRARLGNRRARGATEWT